MARQGNDGLPKQVGEQAVVEPEKKYAVLSRQVDKFTTIRRRVEVTESMCDLCATDLLAANASKFSSDTFAGLRQEEQAMIHQLVKQHKQVYHPATPAATNDDGLRIS
jgi:hypothetical protein